MPSTRPTTTDQHDTRAGQSLAEFTLVAPVLLLIAFGIMEFGFAFRAHQLVTNVAREGARVALLKDATDPGVIAVVEQRLASSGLDPARAEIVLGCDGEVEGLCIGDDRTGRSSDVEVIYPYRFFILGRIARLSGSGDGGFGQVALIGRAVMRNE